MITKICNRCNEEKPRGCFSKNVRYPDNHDNTCDKCKRDSIRSRSLNNNSENNLGTIRQKRWLSKPLDQIGTDQAHNSNKNFKKY